MPYNIITCRGFSEASGWVASGSCLKARIGIVLLFFLIALLRKWGGEEIGIGFSFIFALLLSIFPYLLIIYFFGNTTFAFIGGIVGGLVGGYGGGIIMGEE